MHVDLSDLADIADAFVKHTVKCWKEGNSMGFFMLLNGYGPCRIEAFPDAGHNYYLVLEAIYRYDRMYPNDKIEEGYLQGLLVCANHSVTVNSLSKALNVIVAELEYEKEKVSPFKMDMNSVLEQLRVSLVTNPEAMEEPEYWKSLEKYEQYLNSKYGLSIFHREKNQKPNGRTIAEECEDERQRIRQAVEKYKDMPLKQFLENTLKETGYDIKRLDHVYIDRQAQGSFIWGCYRQDGKYVIYETDENSLPEVKSYSDPYEFYIIFLKNTSANLYKRD